MTFVGLSLSLLIGILIASFFTKILKGIIVTISSLGLLFYFLMATPQQKIKMDEAAMSISSSKFDFLQSPEIQTKINDLKTLISEKTGYKIP